MELCRMGKVPQLRNYVKIDNSRERAVLFLLGDIMQAGMEEWYGETMVVTPTMVAEALSKAGGKPLDVVLSGPGGSVFDGAEIKALLNGYATAQEVVIYGIGLNASMNSILLQSGTKTILDPSSIVMIHNVSGGAWGTADDMRKTADVMDIVEGTLVDAYIAGMAKRGKLVSNRRDSTRSDLQAKMNAETWFNATDAVAYGLADEVGEIPAHYSAYVDENSNLMASLSMLPRIDQGLAAHFKLSESQMVNLKEWFAGKKPAAPQNNAEEAAANPTPEAPAQDAAPAQAPAAEAEKPTEADADLAEFMNAMTDNFQAIQEGFESVTNQMQEMLNRLDALEQKTAQVEQTTNKVATVKRLSNLGFSGQKPAEGAPANAQNSSAAREKLRNGLSGIIGKIPTLKTN